MRLVTTSRGVQAWKDPEMELWHVVHQTQEPYKLGCRDMAMWNYTPQFVSRDLINCPKCILTMMESSL